MEPGFLTSEFDYPLSNDRIAVTPAVPRDHSQLLVLTASGRVGDFGEKFEIQKRKFFEIADFFNPGDLVVINNAKVLPVRLRGFRVDEKTRSKAGAVEAVLLTPETLAPEAESCVWNAFLHLSAKLRPGLKFIFEPGLHAECLSTSEERLQNQGEIRLKFEMSYAKMVEWLGQHGSVPLPHYIEENQTPNQAKDREQVLTQYQTVFASKIGSAAAPTAGFHFTPELMGRLQAKGVSFAELTLHVGIGTFRPIKTKTLSEHFMHEETFEVSPELREKILETKKRQGRVVAVGTTVTRSLESWYSLTQGSLDPGTFKTNLFINPGFRFQMIDDLITNFHLPQSTLLVLVSAAMGNRDDPKVGIARMKEAYAFAMDNGFRFYSFGDAMLLRGKN